MQSLDRAVLLSVIYSLTASVGHGFKRSLMAAFGSDATLSCGNGLNYAPTTHVHICKCWSSTPQDVTISGDKAFKGESGNEVINTDLIQYGWPPKKRQRHRYKGGL